MATFAEQLVTGRLIAMALFVKKRPVKAYRTLVVSHHDINHVVHGMQRCLCSNSWHV